MSSPSRPPQNDPNLPSTPRPRWLTWLRTFDVREAWWQFLDVWEERRAVRRCAYFALVTVVIGAAVWFWAYPWWARRNAIRIARQWIAAGQLSYAAETVQKAIEADPKEPELWLLAAELARLNKQPSMEVQYVHQAVLVRPGESKYLFEWASAALHADLPDEAERALSGMPAEELARSSFAQRIFGEIARRKNLLADAAKYFEAGLKIDGPGGVNELPLGLCLLKAPDANQRQRGVELLTKLTKDPEWGAGALRILLTDASIQNDLPAMLRWAEALRTNPRCTVGDMPNCLAAIARADEGRFSEIIILLKQAHSATPESAAQLIGWLNQIGHSAEALAWMRLLPEKNVQLPPLSVGKAEALRQVGEWAALRDWTTQGEWGASLDFLRWAYGFQAARSLGDASQAEKLWRLLSEHAQANGVHALFAGSTIFSWGLVQEAEMLWWQAAEQNNNIAVEALGTLARHYQVRRDAEGQYKVFNQLHALHPQDDAVTNNFAFFAALTGNRERLAEQLARDNAAKYPLNSTYQATHAFVLLMRGHPDQALKIINPLAGEAEKSSAVAFVYGLALARTGEKTAGKVILQRIDPATLTLREVELLKVVLSG
jgi:Flp pilus assembly protein TadD